MSEARNLYVVLEGVRGSGCRTMLRELEAVVNGRSEHAASLDLRGSTAHFVDGMSPGYGSPIIPATIAESGLCADIFTGPAPKDGSDGFSRDSASGLFVHDKSGCLLVPGRDRAGKKVFFLADRDSGFLCCDPYKMGAVTEVLLRLANMQELLQKSIVPVLSDEKDSLVVCARSLDSCRVEFLQGRVPVDGERGQIDSSCAPRQFEDLASVASQVGGTEAPVPDLVLILDLPGDVAYRRVQELAAEDYQKRQREWKSEKTGKGGKAGKSSTGKTRKPHFQHSDRYWYFGEEHFGRVASGFNALEGERYQRINANRPISEVLLDVCRVIQDLIKK